MTDEALRTSAPSAVTAFAGMTGIAALVALISLLVFAVNRSGDLSSVLTPGGRRLGLAAGAAMAVGIIALAGVVMGIDSFEATPPWLWIYGLGWFGIYLLYPAWCLLLARSAR